MNISKNSKKWNFFKQIALVFVIVPSLMLTLTGCQMAKEIFGKEYRMIDEFFEQMEADIIFSCQAYYDENGISGNVSENAAVELAIARFDEQKAAWKEALRIYGSSDISELENAMEDSREQLRQELAEAGIELKSTTIERSMLGSVWHFIRNHWLITFIILGILGNIPECIENIANKRKKDH